MFMLNFLGSVQFSSGHGHRRSVVLSAGVHTTHGFTCTRAHVADGRAVATGRARVAGLQAGMEYMLRVSGSDPVRFRTSHPSTAFAELYRVSEYTTEVDFLDNHNSASKEAQIGFLTSTNDNDFFKLAASPVTLYCVEHVNVTQVGRFAPYVSCNGPEARPRNDPKDPVCICDVYADRLIAQQPATQMNADCGAPTFNKDGTHSDPTCYCPSPDGQSITSQLQSITVNYTR